MAIKILLVGDCEISGEGLESSLSKRSGLTVAGETVDGGKAVEMVKQLKPDVVIMDVEMADFDGADVTREIVSECPQTRVIATSSQGRDSVVIEMFKAGVAGYILKEAMASELVEGIEAVAQGRSYLCKGTAAIVCYGDDGDVRPIG